MRRPLCIAALVVTGLLWLLLSLIGLPPDPYASVDADTIWCIGTVAGKEYKQGTDSLTLLVTIDHIQDTSIDLSLRDRDSVLVRIPLDQETTPNIAIGSRVRVCGTFAALQPASNHGGFDSYLYYRTLGYVFQIRRAQIETVMEAGTGSAFDNALYAVKSRLRAVIYACCLREDDADILAAMMLGEKGWLDNDIKDLYQSAGIIHILAISGLHITIIGMGFCRLLERTRLPRWVSAAASALLMLLYGRMTGLSASSARAIIMFLLRILARQMHRTYDLLTALSVAGILVLLEQPLYLYNTGFQFSYGAVLSIGLLTPILPADILRMADRRRMRRLQLWWRERCAVHPERLRSRYIPLPTLSLQGLAVTIGTFPITLMAYGTFSLYAVVLNALVLPLMGLVMTLGLLMMGSGLIWQPLGQIVAWPVSYLLHFYLLLCEIAQTLPGHTQIPGHPEPGTVLCFLFLISLLLYLFSRYQISAFHVLLWITVSLQLLTWHNTAGLRLHIIDVGQGDGIYMECDGTRILIDGGSTDQSDVARYQLEPLLEYYGASVIDLAIMTHEDNDHMNGLLMLLTDQEERGIRIRRLAMPDVDPAVQGDNYRAVQAAAEAAGTEIIYLHQGSELTAGHLSMICLNPGAGTQSTEPNATSVVLYLTYGSFTALLTGDLEGEGEAACLAYMRSRPDLFCRTADGDPETADAITLLKVAHHGSRGATGTAFLEAVHPQYAAISCGEDNIYGHPHAETLERLSRVGAEIYDTRGTGEMTFSTDGRTLRIDTYTGK